MSNGSVDPLDIGKTLERSSVDKGGYLLAAGQSLGQYRIVRTLGRGGMGEVYEAENAVNRKRVALKVLPRRATGGTFVERFRIESRVMSDLRHPHIVEVLHTGEESGLYYLTMDLVTGPGGGPQSLEDILSLRRRGAEGDREDGLTTKDTNGTKGGLPEREVREYALQVLDALGHAHGRDVVHRDLKPANILVSADGALKVTDFGLAKVVGGEYLKSVIDRSVSLSMACEVSVGERETVAEEGQGGKGGSSARALLGTYDYMAPEQKSGGEITPRTDLYAFGVMLYRMLTGEKPEGRWKLPSEYGVSRRWDGIVGRCMERDPADRYASAAELKRDIERVVCKGTDRGPRIGRVAAGGKGSSKVAEGKPRIRRMARMGLVAAVAAAALGLGGYRAYRSYKSYSDRLEVGRQAAAPQEERDEDWAMTAVEPAPVAVPAPDGGTPVAAVGGMPSEDAVTPPAPETAGEGGGAVSAVVARPQAQHPAEAGTVVAEEKGRAEAAAGGVAAGALELRLAVEGGDRLYRGGERVVFVAQANQDCHLGLVCHQPDGSVVVLFPNPYHPDSRVKAGEQMRIPGEVDPSFEIIIGPPYGEDRVEAVACVGRSDLHALMEKAAGGNRQGYGVMERGVYAEGIGKLEQAVRLDGGQKNVARSEVRIRTRE